MKKLLFVLWFALLVMFPITTIVTTIMSAVVIFFYFANAFAKLEEDEILRAQYYEDL